jgi:hypothetical protein
MDRSLRRSAIWLKGVGTVLGLLPLSFLLRTAPSVYFKPLTEDGFYSLTVARNLATGHGLTIDGTHLTNGFQPLVTVLDALAFLGHDARASAVRLVLGLSWLVLAGTCAMAALVARDLATSAAARRLAPWLAVVALLSGRYVLYAFNGLETGGELLGCLAVWRLYQVRGADDRRHCVMLGAALGALVLVRIDMLAVTALTCALVYRERRGRGGGRLAGLTALAALVVSAPWWLYNQIAFGQLMPSSGRAEQSIRLTFSRLPSLVIGATQDLLPWGYSARTQTFWFSIVELALLTAGGAWLWRRPRLIEVLGEVARRRRERGVQFAWVLAGATLALAIFYFVETDAVWFYGRYLAPVLLVSSVAGAAGVLNRGLGTARVLAVLASVALVVGVVFTFHFDRHATSPYYRDQLALIESHVPAGQLVGAGQSGTIGFLRADVVNLDGKVNEQALAHQGDMRVYLRERGVRWLCDQGDYVTRYLSEDPVRYGWHEVASKGTFELWRRSG